METTLEFILLFLIVFWANLSADLIRRQIVKCLERKEKYSKSKEDANIQDILSALNKEMDKNFTRK